MPGKCKDRKGKEPATVTAEAGVDGVDGVRLTNIQNALTIMNVAPVLNPDLPVILLPGLPQNIDVLTILAAAMMRVVPPLILIVEDHVLSHHQPDIAVPVHHVW